PRVPAQRDQHSFPHGSPAGPPPRTAVAAAPGQAPAARYRRWLAALRGTAQRGAEPGATPVRSGRGVLGIVPEQRGV
ncbi:hypothetical protein PJM56_30255, partial [Mycobacterium kansasii]